MLDFISSRVELYFLLCDKHSPAAAIVRRMLEILRSDAYASEQRKGLRGHRVADVSLVDLRELQSAQC